MRVFRNHPQDSNAAEITQFYDRSGRLIQTSREMSGGITELTQYTYDESNRLIQTSRGMSGGITELTQYAYDESNRLVQVTTRQMHEAPRETLAPQIVIVHQQNFEDDEKEPERNLTP